MTTKFIINPRKCGKTTQWKAAVEKIGLLPYQLKWLLKSPSPRIPSTPSPDRNIWLEMLKDVSPGSKWENVKFTPEMAIQAVIDDSKEWQAIIARGKIESMKPQIVLTDRGRHLITKMDIQRAKAIIASRPPVTEEQIKKLANIIEEVALSIPEKIPEITTDLKKYRQVQSRFKIQNVRKIRK